MAHYFQLHPAAPQLRGLRAAIDGLHSEPAVSLLPIPAPELVDLPSPAPPGSPELPDPHPDRERARQVVREEFAVRRLAQPDRFEDRYQAELDRLRRRYLLARVEIPEIETEPQLAEAARRAQEMDRLERRIRELDDSPARRALLSLEELRERRTQREQAQRALEDLHREEIRRLRDALTVSRRKPRGEPEIPAAELARVERERNEGKVSADLELLQEEQKALARLDSEVLPLPAAAEPPPFAAPPDQPQLAPGKRLAQPQPAPKPVGSPSLQPTRLALQREYESLRAAIFRDLKVVSREAARREGIELHPRSARVPDRTRELLPMVRRLLAAAPTGKYPRMSKSGKTEEGKKGNDE